MKKALLFALPLLLFALLAAPSAPFVTHRVEIRIDGEALAGESVKTDVYHHLRAMKAGGYAALYQKLRAKYTAKEALNYLGVGLGDYLSAACEARKVDPLDATLEWTEKLSAPFIYYKERAGKLADLDALGLAVARAMDGSGAANCLSEEVPPAVTLDDLKARTQTMGEFSTAFRTSGEARRNNIRLAAEAINGTVIAPSETFSFNQTVGERTEDRGYQVANIVVNGTFVKGVGGGVCQVSTTLYNAVLFAGLKVENAAAHSCPVSYVSYSRDCTVSSAIDFTFTNTTDSPVYVAAEVNGDAITFRLFGKKTGTIRSLESEVVERIAPKAVDEQGAPLSDVSMRPLLQAGREGVRSELYAVSVRDGKTERTLIRKNYYPPKDAVYGSISSSEQAA